MIKKYLIADSTLENEDELKQSLGNEGFKKYLQDNKIKIIEVLKLSDLKKEIETFEKSFIKTFDRGVSIIFEDDWLQFKRNILGEASSEEGSLGEE